MFSCGALIQSQSYRGGHAQIGRDRQRLKKERKIRRHEHQDMHNVSLLFVEVLGLGIFRASDMLYKCLPTIKDKPVWPENWCKMCIFTTLRHRQVFLARKKASTPPAASPTRLLSYIP